MSISTIPWREAPAQAPSRDLHTLYTRRQLDWALCRERERADRNNLQFSLVLFRVRADQPRLTFRLARLLVQGARTIDELGWFDETCIAALLPYTSADGARTFSEKVLKSSREQLIPTLCRIYTYPSAWYFEEDGPGAEQNGNRSNGHSSGKSDGDSNGGSSGSSNGGSNGGSRVHGAASQTISHVKANSHPEIESNIEAASDSYSQRGVATQTISQTQFMHCINRNVAMQATELMPYVVQGMTDSLQMPEATVNGVESLLVRPLPWWKRCVDIIGAGTGLLVFSPILLAVAAAIKLTSKGPVMFKQRRAGLGGNPFWIYKFRTMIVNAEAHKAALRKDSEQDGPAFKLKNDPRVTRIGKLLRTTSLDELPQLWNVMKGDMSLVGPRPLPMDESAACDRWHRRRLDVTPGLTCIWQVKGRSRVTFDQWMRMDVGYIRKLNLWHDVKILSQTIPAVLLRRGAR